MLRRVLHWLGTRLRSGDEEESESDDSRFVPSVLDASVRYAHGGTRTGLESEIAQLEEKRRILEENQRER